MGCSSHTHSGFAGRQDPIAQREASKQSRATSNSSQLWERRGHQSLLQWQWASKVLGWNQPTTLQLLSEEVGSHHIIKELESCVLSEESVEINTSSPMRQVSRGRSTAFVILLGIETVSSPRQAVRRMLRGIKCQSRLSSLRAQSNVVSQWNGRNHTYAVWRRRCNSKMGYWQWEVERVHGVNTQPTESSPWNIGEAFHTTTTTRKLV